MRDKHSSRTLLLVIVGLVIAITGSTGLVLRTYTPSTKPTVSLQASAEKQATSNFTYLKYQGKEGASALALLKTQAKVATKDSSYGPYVDSINSVKGGTNGKYWAFYVNGSMSQVGADAYITKNGDKIEWKLE